MSLPVLEGSKPSRDEVLRIHIDLGTERLHVGTLSFQDPFWLFRYSPEFIKREDVPAISAFPDKTKTYMSRELWPFFRVRLPPPRDDVQEAMDEYGIRSSD
ncbi:MAG: HipA N-terminal domain-containing protein, partial [Chloroflexota bacterium]